MINVENLAFSYNKESQIFKDISFHGMKGLCTAVLGNNGAGKSTLVKCLNRILDPQEGQVHVNGKNIQRIGRKDIAKAIAYVAQRNPMDQVTVFDAVLLGRKPYIKFEPVEEDYEIVKSVIRRMGLKDYELRHVDELSGGELQKVMLARALVQQPEVLLLDEPTSSLDLCNQYEVLECIKEIAKSEDICVLIVIHDLNLALRYCDRFLFLKDQNVLSYGDKTIVTEKILKEVYKMQVAVENVRGVPVIIPKPQA
ncbi:MAG TPA: iron ABC transporter ATP-binding protein [Eubacteriaceae bacterium]|nr:iron ABC transporter ATP-binding protein [Eubacteriaceae bacterium]